MSRTWSRRALGEARRRDGIKRALSGAPDAWVDAAKDAVCVCSAYLRDFTTDDVQELLETLDVGRPRDSRAWGGIMVMMSRGANVCRPTGRYRKSTDPTCNRRPKAVWASTVLHTPLAEIDW